MQRYNYLKCQNSYCRAANSKHRFLLSVSPCMTVFVYMLKEVLTGNI